MRVLIAAPDQTFTREGGLRTQVTRTVEELQRIGCKITYFDGVRTIRPGDFDLAHVFSMNSPTYFKSLAIKNLGIPIVFSSVMWRTGNRLALNLVTKLLSASPKMLLNDLVACRTMAKWALRVLPNTNAELKWLVDVCDVDSRKCIVVPNGVDDLAFDTEESGLPEMVAEIPEGDFVLSVCVLDDRKRLRSLVNTCKSLGYPLVHVGPSTDLALAQWMHDEKSRGANITFVGQVPYKSDVLAALYKRCRVFALPSQYETPGIAALEAGLFEAVIVITSVGGADEYFGNYGIYTDPNSDSDLLHKLRLGWETSRECQKGLRSHLIDKFSWRAVAESTYSAYQEALEKSE